MRVPFVHTDVVALLITPDQVCAYQLRRTPRSLHLRRVTQEEVDPTEGVLPALIRLKVQLPSNSTFTSHLDSLQVQHRVIEGPALEEEEAVEMWLARKTRTLLPPAQDPEDFVVRVKMLLQTDEGTQALIAVARREAVLARDKLLRDAELTPTSLCSIGTALEQVLALDPVFVEEEAVVLHLRPSEVVWLRYSGGRLLAFDGFDWRGEPLTLSENLRRRLAEEQESSVRRIYLVGPEAERIQQEIQIASWVGPPLVAVRVPVESKDQAFSASEHVPGVAVALEASLAGDQAINFLAPDEARSRRQDVEKKEALLSILVLGAILLTLILIPMVAGVYLEQRTSAVEEQLLALSDEVGEIEHARLELKNLEASVQQAEGFVVERTQVASLLLAVAKQMPKHLWLDALNIEPGTPIKVTINGVAFSELEVANYVSVLERLAESKNVRLVYSQAQRAGRLYRKSNVARERTLTQFEIAFEYRQ